MTGLGLEFYLAAVPAALLTGISKGGFGGGLGILAVPLMALAIGPVQAAAILLPILCAIDLIGVWAYRGRWDTVSLRILLPAALLGIVLGALSFGFLDAAMVRLLLGTIAVGFSLHFWFNRSRSGLGVLPHSLWRGGLWGGLAGFTSFVAHAGGPPIQVYLLPRQHDKTLYQATTVVFFIVVNYIKLIPYTLLGQFTSTNLIAALSLLPVAALGMGLGIWLHDKVPVRLFFRLCYAFLLVTGLKLLYDGLGPWLLG